MLLRDQVPGHSVVPVESRGPSAVRIVRERDALETENWQSGELAIGNARVVDSVPATDNRLVVDPIREAKSGTPRIAGRTLEPPRAGPARPAASEQLGTQSTSRIRIRRVEIERRIHVGGFDPCSLIVPAQSQREGQCVRDLALDIDPRCQIPLVKGRLRGNLESAAMHLAQDK